MLGLDMESILAKLAENPQVLAVIEQVKQVCNGIVIGMSHFNARFDKIEQMHTSNGQKLDEILFHLKHPSDIAPAGDDGLMGLLAAGGEEMIIVEPEPMPEANNDGSKKETVN